MASWLRVVGMIILGISALNLVFTLVVNPSLVTFLESAPSPSD